jgi:hypothetical protein
MGADATDVASYGAWLHLYPKGCETLSPTAVRDGRTISVDFDCCNRGVGPYTVIVARELAPVRRRSRRKTGHCGVSVGIGWQGLGLLRSPAEQAPSPQRPGSYTFFGSRLIQIVPTLRVTDLRLASTDAMRRLMATNSSEFDPRKKGCISVT